MSICFLLHRDQDHETVESHLTSPTTVFRMQPLREATALMVGEGGKVLDVPRASGDISRPPRGSETLQIRPPRLTRHIDLARFILLSESSLIECHSLSTSHDKPGDAL